MATRFGRTYTWTRKAGEGDGCGRILLGILFIALLFGVPFGLLSTERSRRDFSKAMREVDGQVVPVNANLVEPSNVGKLIHLSSSDVEPVQLIEDADFGLDFPHAVRLRRRVQYCQWLELVWDNTHRDSSGREHVERTYTYTLSWHDTRLPSLLYNQAVTHHNPPRDPFPPAEAVTNAAHVGAYTIPSPFLTQLHSFKTVHFHPQHLGSFTSSRAAQQDNSGHFRYIGQGYFYSAYEPEVWEKTLRVLGMTFEGTLLDYQLGDLFRQCTPGDIRIWFETVEPMQISVVGKQSSADGLVSEFLTSSGYHLGLAEEGIVDAVTMFENHASSLRWHVVLLRLGMIGWAVAIVYYLGLLSSYPTAIRLFASASLAAAGLGIVHVIVWQQLTTFVLSCFIPAVLAGIITSLVPVPLTSKYEVN